MQGKIPEVVMILRVKNMKLTVECAKLKSLFADAEKSVTKSTVCRELCDIPADGAFCLEQIYFFNCFCNQSLPSTNRATI